MDEFKENAYRAKRRKLDSDTFITSSKDLHRLLHSDQSLPPLLKAALQRFKEFLVTIRQSEKGDDVSHKLQVLKAYSEEQVLSDQQSVAFPDLIVPWSSAVESNNESLLSLVPSVLAIYLKTISSLVEFRHIGSSLCKSLLLKEQLRLFDRGLTATKNKEHLISPCLRLLTEIVSFDGGDVANLVFSKRDTTFRRLDLFLDQRNSRPDVSADAPQKPSLRRIAQRYLLANLKFQPAGAKEDIIGQGRIMKAFLQHLRADKADVTSDSLSSLEKDVLKDNSLPTSVKRRLFSHSNLSLLASLYTFHEPIAELTIGKSVRDQTDMLLRLICMQQNSGVLSAENGWYPAGNDPHQALPPAVDANHMDLAIKTISNLELKDKFPVKNGILAAFIQNLRPENDQLQASLLLDIFRAAPELIADYFSKKKNFVTEPKDTPHWLGQSAFFFSVIQLPVPRHCGWKNGFPALPPPTSTVIESILPRPLDRLNTTKSLNLNHEVITLFAVRAIGAAFQKLTEVLEVYSTAISNSASWKQASSSLLLAFSQRCPLPKDVLSTLQRAPKSDRQLHSAIIELIARYYQVLPHLMLPEKFDTSLSLVDTINRLGEHIEDPDLQSSGLSVLDNLLKITEMSSDTKWWHKPDSLKYSAFTSMLRTILEVDRSVTAVPSIMNLLRRIAAEHGILPGEPAYFEALIASFKVEDDWSSSASAISFFDNCASRIARQPVRYEDLAAGARRVSTGICLLPFCIVEQWRYVAGDEDHDHQKSIATWIARCLALLTSAGEERATIDRLLAQIVRSTKKSKLKKSLVENYEKALKETAASQLPTALVVSPPLPISLPLVERSPETCSELEGTFGAPLKDIEPLEGPESLSPEDLSEAIGSGRLGRLCTGLASTVEETRRQAFMTLQTIMNQIPHSSYTEKGPMYVLLGELLETAKVVGFADPFPSILSNFAAEAAEILNQASHPMYGKINKFLQKGPLWHVHKFIPYWAKNILLREPEDDNGYSEETAWILTLLVGGVRCNEDTELYRKSNIFQHVLTLYSSTLCSETHGRQILELVYRCIKLEGGMTLITRAAIESWLTAANHRGRNKELAKELERALYDGVDRKAVQQWRFPSIMTIPVS